MLEARVTCNGCNEARTDADFYYHKRKKRDGEVVHYRYQVCKTCHNSRMRKWTAENPDKVRDIRRRGNLKRDPDAHKAYMKAYHAKRGYVSQTEEQKQRRREAAKADPERMMRYRAKWLSRPENRQKYNAWQANRRALVRSAEGSFTAAEWLALCEAAFGKCLRCGLEEDLTIDHVIPLSMGGTNHISNIQPLCKFCNCMKGARHIDYR